MCSANTPTFYADELRQALQEQSFGIHAFSIMTTTSLQATAFVKLLEGNDVTLTLSTNGYAIESATSPKNTSDTTFESVETLLQSISLLYVQRRHDAWVKKLEKLTT